MPYIAHETNVIGGKILEGVRTVTLDDHVAAPFHRDELDDVKDVIATKLRHSDDVMSVTECSRSETITAVFAYGLVTIVDFQLTIG